MHLWDDVSLPVKLTDVVRGGGLHLGDSHDLQDPITVIPCIGSVANLEFSRLHGRLTWDDPPGFNFFGDWLGRFHVGWMPWALPFLQIRSTNAIIRCE